MLRVKRKSSEQVEAMDGILDSEAVTNVAKCNDKLEANGWDKA